MSEILKPLAFEKVWYRSKPKGLSSLRAYEDVGSLIVDIDHLRFDGKKHRVEIRDVQRVSVERHGSDFVNKWVTIEYGNGQRAMFADGSSAGWGGIVGGSDRIAQEIRETFKLAER